MEVTYKILNYKDKDHKCNYYLIDGTPFYHGEEKTYRDGKLLSVFNYRWGQLNGEFIKYYKNGKVAAHGFYLKNQVEGFYRAWDENGNMFMHLFCVKGNAVQGYHMLSPIKKTRFLALEI